jgi:hypothetical protein
MLLVDQEYIYRHGTNLSIVDSVYKVALVVHANEASGSIVSSGARKRTKDTDNLLSR